MAGTNGEELPKCPKCGKEATPLGDWDSLTYKLCPECDPEGVSDVTDPAIKYYRSLVMDAALFIKDAAVDISHAMHEEAKEWLVRAHRCRESADVRS